MDRDEQEFARLLGYTEQEELSKGMSAETHLTVGVDEGAEPEKARADYLAQISAAVAVLKPDSKYAEPGLAEADRAAYADGAAVKMFGRTLSHLDLHELRHLARNLKQRVRSKQYYERAKSAGEDREGQSESFSGDATVGRGSED